MAKWTSAAADGIQRGPQQTIDVRANLNSLTMTLNETARPFGPRHAIVRL